MNKKRMWRYGVRVLFGALTLYALGYVVYTFTVI